MRRDFQGDLLSEVEIDCPAGGNFFVKGKASQVEYVTQYMDGAPYQHTVRGPSRRHSLFAKHTANKTQTIDET